MVLYLSGGNDALSMLVPYNDPFYYSRRPTIAVPAGSVLQVGTDSSRSRSVCTRDSWPSRQIFNRGHLALIQRTGYSQQSRSPTFKAPTSGPWPILGNSSGLGWVGRYL